MFRFEEDRGNLGVESIGVARAVDHAGAVFIWFERWVGVCIDPEWPEGIV